MSNIPGKVKKRIQEASHLVDQEFVHASSESFREYSLSLPVPSQHLRADELDVTQFVVKPLLGQDFSSDSYCIISSSLENMFVSQFIGDQYSAVHSSEKGLKDIVWLDRFVGTIPQNTKTIVGIGGGIILNAAAYIAEMRHLEFISVPTTVLAAGDAAIGGIIRLNKTVDGRLEKNSYKSAYEPNEIIIDTRFLDVLSRSQIGLGCSEIIKHGVYQSFALLEYLASVEFEPFNSQNSLLKAICWTVALKNVVIMEDPESLDAGGVILRGGHKLAREIEEKNTGISHGEAVAIGVYQDIHQPEVMKLLDRIYDKLQLPRSERELIK